MTTELKDVMTFLIERWPEKSVEDLSYQRITKMIYLADWHFVLKNKRQMTNINWYFDAYGPFVKDIEETVAQNNDVFVVDFGDTRLNIPIKTLSLRNPDQKTDLGEKEKTSLKHIIKVTSDRPWQDFMTLVYSTYPVQASERYTHLDLIKLAVEYRKVIKSQRSETDKRLSKTRNSRIKTIQTVVLNMIMAFVSSFTRQKKSGEILLSTHATEKRKPAKT